MGIEPHVYRLPGGCPYDKTTDELIFPRLLLRIIVPPHVNNNNALRSSLSPFLNIGVTEVVFQTSGKQPSLKDFCMIKDRRNDKDREQLLSSSCERRSSPGDVDIFILLKRSSTVWDQRLLK